MELLQPVRHRRPTLKEGRGESRGGKQRTQTPLCLLLLLLLLLRSATRRTWTRAATGAPCGTTRSASSASGTTTTTTARSTCSWTSPPRSSSKRYAYYLVLGVRRRRLQRYRFQNYHTVCFTCYKKRKCVVEKYIRMREKRRGSIASIQHSPCIYFAVYKCAPKDCQPPCGSYS